MRSPAILQVSAVALAVGLCAAPGLVQAQGSASAALSAEVFVEAGGPPQHRQIYAQRRALVLDAATGPGEVDEAAAWLRATGFGVTRVTLDDAQPDAGAALDRWLRSVERIEDALLLVVLNLSIGFSDDGETLIASRRSDGPGAGVGAFLRRLDEASAKHILVISADAFANDGRVAAPLRASTGALGPRDLESGRILLAPSRSVSGAALDALSRALMGDAGDGFDPDGAITALDLAESAPALSAWSFGRGSGLGNPVVALRRSLEGAFGEETPRDLYQSLRGVRDLDSLERVYAALSPKNPFAVWLDARIGQERTRVAEQAARICGEGLTFDAAARLELGVATIGRLEPFNSAAELARHMLEAVRDSTDLSQRRREAVLRDCRIARETAPGSTGLTPAVLDLRIATLASADPQDADDAIARLLALLDDPDTERKAATLAGLTIAAHGGDPAVRRRVMGALRRGVRDKHPPSAFVMGLMLLEDGPNAEQEGVDAILSAATSGMALARATAGALARGSVQGLPRIDVEPDLALQWLEAARRRGLYIATDLVDIEAEIARQRTADEARCAETLRVDFDSLISVANVMSERDLNELVSAPGTFLGRGIGGALEGWRSACEAMLKGGALPDQLARDLALALLADNRPEVAAQLTPVRPSGNAALDLAAALVAIEASRAPLAEEFLLSARAAGSPTASLIAAFRSDGLDDDTWLRSAAADGLPAALYAIAFRYSRSNDGWDAVSALGWMLQARRNGFAVSPEASAFLESRAGEGLSDAIGLGLTEIVGNRPFWLQGEGVAVDSVREGAEGATLALSRGAVLEWAWSTGGGRALASDDVPTTWRRLVETALGATDGAMSLYANVNGSLRTVPVKVPDAVFASAAIDKQWWRAISLPGSVSVYDGPSDAHLVIERLPTGASVEVGPEAWADGAWRLARFKEQTAGGVRDRFGWISARWTR